MTAMPRTSAATNWPEMAYRIKSRGGLLFGRYYVNKCKSELGVHECMCVWKIGEQPPFINQQTVAGNSNLDARVVKFV